MAKPAVPAAPNKPTFVLVLQGGGALGAYHIGAFQALTEHGLDPDWFSGISIGAINAAILAGNKPAERLARLEQFWREISWPDVLAPLHLLPLEILHNTLSNAEALLLGQPNFFRPRAVSPYLTPAGSPTTASFYDTSPLRETLQRLASFELINKGPARLTLGATDIATGDLVFFDSRGGKPIGPEHVAASGSLPPGFPATEIGGRFYWDGGCVSNTPLEAVLEDQPAGHTVVFMIDLWNAAGKPPTTMNEVMWRAKEIQYASRTWTHVDAVATKCNLRHAMRLLREKGVPEVDKAFPDDVAVAAGQRLDIVHIVYHPGEDQIPNSDAEFSRQSIEKRREAGYRDMQAALAAQPWLRAEKPAHVGALVHRVMRERVVTRGEPKLDATTEKVAKPAA